MGIGNKLYLIGVKCPLPQLAEKIALVENYDEEPSVGYFGFWDNICFIEYDQDTKEYIVKENEGCEVHYYRFVKEQQLFWHMDEHNIQFVSDENPLGDIFQSYSAAYLSVVRWVADVVWTRDLYNNLLEG